MLGIGAREALGLQVDGQRVLVAHLRRQGRQVAVAGLRSASLASRLEVGQEGERAAGPASPGDILGLAEEPAAKGGEEEGSPPETNTEILYRLLERFPTRRCSLAFSLVESCVFFTLFEDNFGLKGKRLKERLLAQTEKGRTAAGDLSLAERHAFCAAGPGRLLSILHEDPLELLGLLDSLTPFIGRVRVRSIAPLEVALMDLARMAHAAAEEAMAVVYVGEEYSRVIFMRQGECLALSQPIHEGLASSQVLQTVSSRILYEQDNNDLPEIGQVILSGGCLALQAQPFFAGQFPQAQVEYLAAPALELGGLEEAEREQVSAFAVPIGLALKALGPQDRRRYPVNFLPRARRKQQNPFELAWHGLLLLALLAAAALWLGSMAQAQERRLAALALSAEVLESQVRESAGYVQVVDELNARISEGERRFALLDTLEAGRLRWAGRLGEVARAVQLTDGIWLERLTTAEGNLDVRRDVEAQGLPRAQALSLYGKSLYRDRVPELAQRLGEGLVRSSVRDQIRGRTVHQFDMRVPVARAGEGH
jgi:hypothetical protein